MTNHTFSWDHGELKVSASDRIAYKVKSEKWLLFLSILSCGGGGAPMQVRPEDLMRFHVFNVGRNGAKTPVTICNEVGNFIHALESAGVNCIAYAQKYRGGWSLSSHVEFSENLQSQLHHVLLKHSYAQFHDAFRLTESEQTLSDWAQAAVSAKLAFAGGRMKESYARILDALTVAQSPFLKAATYAEIARITYRADTDFSLDMRELSEEFAQDMAAHPVLKAIYEPRIQSYNLFADTAVLPAGHKMHMLGNMFAGFMSGPDVAGLARLCNTYFVVARRTGDAQRSQHVKDALRAGLVLALTSGDLDLIQSSLFNYALSLEPTKAPDVYLDTRLELCEFNMRLQDRMKVGGDNAQGALYLANLYIDRGDFAAAKRAKAVARTKIAVTANQTDRAYYRFTTARFWQELRTTSVPLSHKSRVRKWLRDAIELYQAVENAPGEAMARTYLSSLTQP